MPNVVYIGPFAEGVEIAETGQWANPGEPVEVPTEVAGRAPKGKPEDEDYDSGEGLLAQPANWAKAGTKAAKAAVEATSEESSNW
jgi:hypothetical protein